MIEFTSEGKWEITGRGPAFAVTIPQEFNSDMSLMGKEVMIDNQRCLVKGIERWIKDIGKPLFPGDKVGILVQIIE